MWTILRVLQISRATLFGLLAFLLRPLKPIVQAIQTLAPSPKSFILALPQSPFYTLPPRRIDPPPLIPTPTYPTYTYDDAEWTAPLWTAYSRIKSSWITPAWLTPVMNRVPRRWTPSGIAIRLGIHWNSLPFHRRCALSLASFFVIIWAGFCLLTLYNIWREKTARLAEFTTQRRRATSIVTNWELGLYNPDSGETFMSGPELDLAVDTEMPFFTRVDPAVIEEMTAMLRLGGEPTTGIEPAGPRYRHLLNQESFDKYLAELSKDGYHNYAYNYIESAAPEGAAAIANANIHANGTRSDVTLAMNLRVVSPDNVPPSRTDYVLWERAGRLRAVQVQRVSLWLGPPGTHPPPAPPPAPPAPADFADGEQHEPSAGPSHSQSHHATPASDEEVPMDVDE